MGFPLIMEATFWTRYTECRSPDISIASEK